MREEAVGDYFCKVAFSSLPWNENWKLNLSKFLVTSPIFWLGFYSLHKEKCVPQPKYIQGKLLSYKHVWLLWPTSSRTLTEVIMPKYWMHNIYTNLTDLRKLCSLYLTKLTVIDKFCVFVIQKNMLGGKQLRKDGVDNSDEYISKLLEYFFHLYVAFFPPLVFMLNLTNYFEALFWSCPVYKLVFTNSNMQVK